MDIKAVRKGIKELKERRFPWRGDYGYGFHDAIEQCSEMIEKQIRMYQRANQRYMKTMTKVDKSRKE